MSVYRAIGPLVSFKESFLFDEEVRQTLRYRSWGRGGVGWYYLGLHFIILLRTLRFNAPGRGNISRG